MVRSNYKILKEIDELEKNFNLSPGQYSPIITQNQNKLFITKMRWGLVPFWAKDEKIGYKLFNCRSETILEKASFKYAFQKRRCLVPVNGFYEWKKPEKQPYFIHLKKQKIFSLAAIWESWKTPIGNTLNTFSIITTKPNKSIQNIHNRMPLIIPQKDEEKWILSRNLQDVQSLLSPYPDENMSIIKLDNPVNDNLSNNLIREAVIIDVRR